MEYNISNVNVITTIDSKQLKVSSSEFKDGDFIPYKYTCDGDAEFKQQMQRYVNLAI